VKRSTTIPTYAIIGLLLCSCATEEIIPVALSKESMPVSGLRILVSDFVDLRPDRRRLGLKHAFFGSEDLFQVKEGTPGQDVAKALTQHLTRNGWPVEYVFSSGSDSSGDVVISGSIVELSLDSWRGLISTAIVAKSKLAIQARNKSDGSAITYTVTGSGTYNVFWFEDKDAEDLMREVLESSFNKFVAVTKLDPDGLHFRQPGDSST